MKDEKDLSAALGSDGLASPASTEAHPIGPYYVIEAIGPPGTLYWHPYRNGNQLENRFSSSIREAIRFATKESADMVRRFVIEPERRDLCAAREHIDMGNHAAH